MSSFELIEACPHRGEQGGSVAHGVGCSGPSGPDEVPQHDGLNPCG